MNDTTRHIVVTGKRAELMHVIDEADKGWPTLPTEDQERARATVRAHGGAYPEVADFCERFLTFLDRDRTQDGAAPA